MRNKLKLLPLAAAVLFAPAYAEEKPNTYVGASVGQVTLDNFCESGETGCEEEGVGFRGFVGKQLAGKYLAVEMGLTHAPEAGSFRHSTTNQKGEVEFTAFDIGFMGQYPFNDTFALSARLGLAVWDAHSTLGGSLDGEDVLYGAGLEITPTKSFSIRGEWTRVSAEDNVDYLFLSAAYRF